MGRSHPRRDNRRDTMTGDFYGDTPDQQVTHYDETAGQDTTLREAIAKRLGAYAEAAVEEFDRAYDTDAHAEEAGRILALIREALLSRISVEALTRKLVELGNERAGIEDDVWPDDYHDTVVVVMMDESQAAITAALDAVTGDGR